MSEIKEEHKKRFRRYVEQLNKLMKEINQYCPEANYYLEEDNFNLMHGPSHDDGRDLKPIRDNVSESIWLRGAGGGGW